jgi:hypothetical protein
VSVRSLIQVLIMMTGFRTTQNIITIDMPSTLLNEDAEAVEIRALHGHSTQSRANFPRNLICCVAAGNDEKL